MGSPRWHRSVFVSVGAVLAFMVAGAAPLKASPIVYTFSAPQFVTLGGTFPGGTLAFNSPVPFSSAQRSGFGGRSGGALIAIDDLTLSTTPIPEPGSLMFPAS